MGTLTNNKTGIKYPADDAAIKAAQKANSVVAGLFTINETEEPEEVTADKKAAAEKAKLENKENTEGK